MRLIAGRPRDHDEHVRIIKMALPGAILIAANKEQKEWLQSLSKVAGRGDLKVRTLKTLSAAKRDDRSVVITPAAAELALAAAVKQLEGR
jgi:hypothetical protein